MFGDRFNGLSVNMNSNQLNELEGNKLHELFEANLIYVEQFKVPGQHITKQSIVQIDTFNADLYEKLLRYMVMYSENIHEFNAFCEDDRISLIKYGCYELFYMRSIANYDGVQEHWTFIKVTYFMVNFMILI